MENNMKSNNGKTTDWVDKLSIYQACMDHEQSIRSSYQSLLTTLEVALFSLSVVFVQLKWTDTIWVLATGGIVFCVFFGIACEFRGRNADVWRTYIVKVVEGTDLENAFKEGKYWMFPSKLKFVSRFRGHWGHWFEEILVSIMLIMWLGALWNFYSPHWIRWPSIVAICGYIYYLSKEFKWVPQWK